MKKVDEAEAVASMQMAGFIPLVPYPGIKKPWLCTHTECGETSSPTLYAINKGGRCGYCSGRYIKQETLKKTFSDAKLRLISKYENNHTKMECECLVCGNLISTTYAAVKANGKSCKYCAKNYLSADEIEIRFAEANLKPLESYINSKTKIKCECLICGNTVFPRLNQIRDGDRGCKTCANIMNSKRNLKASNLAKYIEVVSKKGGKLHAEEYVGLKGTYLVECAKGHNWYSTLEGLGITRWCDLCAREIRSEKLRKPISEIQRLFDDAGIEILSEFKSVHKKVKGMCNRCGTAVEVLPSNLQRGQGGCRFCGRKIGGIKNRINPEDARRKFKESGYEILEEYISNNIPVKSKCLNCGEISFPMLHSLTPGTTTCKFCVPHAPLSQEQVEKIYADLGFTLSDKYERSGKPMQCLHLECGNSVRISHNALVSGRGCRYCNFGGFDFNSPGYLYIVYHDVFDSIKVGISGSRSKRDRLKDHKLYDWKLYEKFDFEKGNEAYEAEQDFFRFIRNELKIGVHLVSEQMPQGGFSETMSGEEISLLEVKRLVQDVISGRINLD